MSDDQIFEIEVVSYNGGWQVVAKNEGVEVKRSTRFESLEDAKDEHEEWVRLAEKISGKKRLANH